MGLWGRLFGEPERSLTQVADLDVGDMVRFKLYAPGFLAGAAFEVAAVNTYEYEAGPEYEFVLKGVSPRQLYLTVDPNADDEGLRLSIRIVRNEVAALFDMDSFAEIFDREDGEVRLRCRSDAVPDGLDGWSADAYYRTAFAVPAYFFKGDYRKATVPEDGGEGLDYYALTSSDETRAVEIEVFDGDEDVLLTLIVEPGLVEELWPAGKAR